MPEVQTIVLKVGMHCEGCARKVKKALGGLSGLQEMKVDYAGQKATVKGALDAKQVLDTLSKIGKPGEVLQVTVEPKKPSEDKKEAPKESAPPPQPQTIVLKAMLHCEGCGRKVKDAIKKVHGVQEVNVNYKESKVTVKGFMDPNKVLQKALKTGKHIELCPPEKPKDAPKDSKGAAVEEKKKDAPKGQDKKEAPKGDGKDPPKEGKQESKDDPKNGGKKDPPKENKKKGDGGPNKNGKNEQKEAPKDDATKKEEKKDTPKKENGKEEKKDQPKEDKSSSSRDEKKKEEPKDEKKVPPKEEKNEEQRIMFPQYTPNYMVYKCDACQIFSEDNPNACTLM